MRSVLVLAVLTLLQLPLVYSARGDSPSLADPFAAGVSGTWQGSFCRNGDPELTTDWTISFSPERAFAREKSCSDGCGEIDYRVVQYSPEQRQFLLFAQDKSGEAKAGHHVWFGVSSGLDQMAGRYLGAGRCSSLFLRKTSSEASQGPIFEGTPQPLPQAAPMDIDALVEADTKARDADRLRRQQAFQRCISDCGALLNYSGGSQKRCGERCAKKHRPFDR